MKKTIIGNTGIEVSILGLGTVKFGRNQGVKYPSAFSLPDDATIINLLSHAKSLGINLLDTAPAYGTSEERIGALLADRHQWILSSKVGEEFVDGNSFFDFSQKSVRHSIERSLKRLRTDYLDIVFIHSDGNDEKILRETDVISTLEKFKSQGKIRAFGMSTKTVVGGILAAELTDIVMVTYNPIHTEDLPVIEYAHRHHKGVFLKKALASGHLDKISQENAVQKCIQFALQPKGVNSIIIGSMNAQHIDEVAFYSFTP